MAEGRGRTALPATKVEPFILCHAGVMLSFTLKVLQECLSFCNVKVREIPRSDSYFDALTCLNLVDRHEDPLGLVEHLWRLLKPGGFLLLSSPFDWRESYTPKKAWVNDLCALLPPEKWRVLATCDEFYDIRHSSRYVVRHLSQVVAAQKT